MLWWGVPEVPPNGICNLEQQYTLRINYSQTSNDRNILLEDELGVGTRVQKPPTISAALVNRHLRVRCRSDIRFAQALNELRPLIYSL